MLRDEALSEGQKLRIVATSFLLQSGYSVVSVLWGSGGGSHASVMWSIALRLFIVLVASQLCFRANARGDNRQFVERLFCLSVPLMFWLSLVPYVLDLGLYHSLYAVYGASAYALWRRFYLVILAWIWGRFILSYALLPHFIGIAAGRNSLSSQASFAPLSAP